MELFKNLPTINYNGKTLRNLNFRPKLIEDINIESEAFYPYVVKEGERIDTVSYLYYDSPDYVWLIMLINDIIDPYHDWYLTTRQLEKKVIKKYGSVAAAQSQVLYKIDENGNKYSTDTTAALVAGSSQVITDSSITLTNYTAYDYEVDENEKKKHIVLLDKSYLREIDAQLRGLF